MTVVKTLVIFVSTDQCGQKREGGEPESNVHTGSEGREEHLQVCRPSAQETDAGRRLGIRLVQRVLKDVIQAFFILPDGQRATKGSCKCGKCCSALLTAVTQHDG